MIKSQLSYGNLAIDSKTDRIIEIKEIRAINSNLRENDISVNYGIYNDTINPDQIVPFPASGKVLKDIGFESYSKLKEEAYVIRQFHHGFRWIVYVTIAGNAGYTIRIVKLKETETIAVSTIEIENLAFHTLQNICNNLIPDFELNINVEKLNQKYIGKIPKYNSYKQTDEEYDF